MCIHVSARRRKEHVSVRPAMLLHMYYLGKFGIIRVYAESRRIRKVLQGYIYIQRVPGLFIREQNDKFRLFYKTFRI